MPERDQENESTWLLHTIHPQFFEEAKGTFFSSQDSSKTNLASLTGNAVPEGLNDHLVPWAGRAPGGVVQGTGRGRPDHTLQAAVCPFLGAERLH